MIAESSPPRSEPANKWLCRPILCKALHNLGRKNSLFLGSVEHTAGSALMYSLMECCRMHKVDPHAWLLDVMKRILSCPKDQLADLLPHKWKKL
jgi:hypothetical protein